MAPRKAQPQRAAKPSGPKGVNSFRCRVCRGVHALKKCQRFLHLAAEKRLRAVLINRYCPNCLAHEHSTGSCRSGGTCRTCGQDHHTLLHLPSSQSEMQAPTPSPSPLPPTESLATTQSATISMLPTALVSLDVAGKTFEVRVLLDACSPHSRMPTSLATALGLSAEKGFCRALFRSRVAPDFATTVTLKLEDVHVRTPAQKVGKDLSQCYPGITLADTPCHIPSRVSIVLGADVYGDVILPGLVPSHGGLPLAQNTLFGWVLSGVFKT